MSDIFNDIPNLDIFKGLKSILPFLKPVFGMTQEEFAFEEFFRKNKMLDINAFKFRGNIEENEIDWNEVRNVEKVEGFYLIFLKNGDVYCCTNLIRYFAKKDNIKEAFKELRKIYIFHESKTVN